MTPRPPRAFYDLVSTLVAQDISFREPATPRAAAGSVLEIPTIIAGRSARLVVTWDPGTRLVSVHTAVPGVEVPAEHLAAIEHAITRINHECILPGFQIDPVDRRLSFRAVVPGEPWSLVRKLVERVQSTVERFHARLSAIARGELTA